MPGFYHIKLYIISIIRDTVLGFGFAVNNNDRTVYRSRDAIRRDGKRENY